MTPKEKAKQLVMRFFNDSLEKNYFCGILSDRECKFCALIAVDEIIKAVHVAQTEIEEYKQYWQQVKQEIEKL